MKKLSPRKEYGLTKECHQCKGYGTLDKKKPDHFCIHCSGWGYVEQSCNCIEHEWVLVSNLGRCFNRYKCRNCHHYREIDSSD